MLVACVTMLQPVHCIGSAAAAPGAATGSDAAAVPPVTLGTVAPTAVAQTAPPTSSTSEVVRLQTTVPTTGISSSRCDEEGEDFVLVSKDSTAAAPASPVVSPASPVVSSSATAPAANCASTFTAASQGSGARRGAAECTGAGGGGSSATELDDSTTAEGAVVGASSLCGDSSRVVGKSHFSDEKKERKQEPVAAVVVPREQEQQCHFRWRDCLPVVLKCLLLGLANCLVNFIGKGFEDWIGKRSGSNQLSSDNCTMKSCNFCLTH
jgi:hypothetical protein